MDLVLCENVSSDFILRVRARLKIGTESDFVIFFFPPSVTWRGSCCCCRSSGGGNSITINFLTINVLLCVRCVCGGAAAPPIDDDDDEGGAQFPFVTLAREFKKASIFQPLLPFLSN
jgi:hypothetical protein